MTILTNFTNKPLKNVDYIYPQSLLKENRMIHDLYPASFPVKRNNKRSSLTASMPKYEETLSADRTR